MGRMFESLMKRELYDDDHEIFRSAVRQFLLREVVPHQARWRDEGITDRDAWRRAGQAGLLVPWLDEEYGGPGGTFLHSTIVVEELTRIHESGFLLQGHSDVSCPYLMVGNEEQRKRWLPAAASGDSIVALGLTEPGAGSDLTGIRTRAVRDGDDYVINGSKTFITSGINCDLCILAVRTSDHATNPQLGISLIVVEADRDGFIKSKKLSKIGMHSQDTAELGFVDCRVPISNRLGKEGAGMMYMTTKLQHERIILAATAQGLAEQVLDDTVSYVKERNAFGQPLSKFQNIQFRLADCATKIEVTRHFLDRLIRDHAEGKARLPEASMAKMWCSDMLGEVTDTCLQMFGGYGYMEEYPVARAWVDARVQRIWAGANEIMKIVVARRLGL